MRGVPAEGVESDGVRTRGTTEQGEYRSHARMAMIEPISWDLIEEKVQPSPSYTERFNMKRAFFAPN